MKPEELVSEERLRRICAETCECRNDCQIVGGCSEHCFDGERFFAGARAMLKELGIVKIEEVNLAHYKRDLIEVLLIRIKSLREGAILVKAKESNER